MSTLNRMALLKIGILAILAIALNTHPAQAGAVIKVDEDVSIDVGAQMQALLIMTETDLDGDGSFDSQEDFRVRRARLRLGANVTEYVRAFLQTESGSATGGTGMDMRIIDAWLSLKAPGGWGTLYMGEHMVPANRQNITSAGALMTIDRPGLSYKSLTWGTRSLSRFATSTIKEDDAGLRGDVDVRDTGATFFTKKSMTDSLHVKAYCGIYDGVQPNDSDEERLATRIQFNAFDAEPGYYNSSTYLGTKKTVGLGASYDLQHDVGECNQMGMFDYSYYSLDAFADLPAGPGSLTAEAAYSRLDLDNAVAFDADNNSETAFINPRQSQGDGYYIQAGYLWNAWQPWLEFEKWNSDHETRKGSYDMYRIGVSYFIKGHSANIKLGFEQLEAEAPLGNTTEDSIDTVTLGVYLKY